MFGKHVIKDLSAYCHGELSPHDASGVAEHLIGCPRCRIEFEQIKLGVKLAERLPQMKAPDSLWQDLDARLGAQESTGHVTSAQGASDRPARFPARVWRPRLLAIAATLILALGLGAFWFYQHESRPSWEVTLLNGSPTIGSDKMNDKSRLAVGQWLETDSVSRAKIQVGSIGQVEIDPNSRVKLVQTQPTEHRLELARGRLSAHIWAPPRLFFVDTPSGVAADLGCAYTLEVNEEGGSLLHVTSGWVALQLRDRESMVPAGAACATRRGIGPGTPYFEDASESFRQALSKLDFEPNTTDSSKTASLNLVLLESRRRDTLTLWHLLSRLEGTERSLVYERLAVLSPPPAGVTRDGVLQLDDGMLKAWKPQLENTWSNDSGLKKAWLKVWTGALGKVKGVEGKK
ncbi:MAG: zf-HC2 domain-containing protein [Pyrinomonadaceae bacterium]|nr:zf-HC2 domain-containing protein [Pyrinomonadaceae bacterium]